VPTFGKEEEMARREPSSIHRGFFYNWGRKQPTQAAGQARLQIYKDGLQIMSFDDDGTDTSGDSNGPQTRMNQTATTTGDVMGLMASPRVASGFNAASLTAIKAEPILKGTNSLSGDFRCLELLMDDSGSNSIGADVSAIRVYSQLNVNPSNDFSVMEVEAQGDTGAWDYFLKLPNDSSMAWTALTTGTQSGAIKVKIGSATRYIALQTSTPA
jgi:hypothetical protein